MRSDPSPAPIQHIVPRHYLRGFADPSARTDVWVYTKGQAYSTGNEVNPRRNPFRQAIRSAGAARGAYTLRTLAGAQLDADPVITQQEGWGVEVLRKLRERAPISVDEKIHFSIYIDLMADRTPARAARALPFVRKAMQDFPWYPLQRMAAEEGKFDLARKLDPRVPENVAAFEREQSLRGLMQRSQAIVKQIAMMRWLFFTLDGDQFFPTTDNPAYFPPGVGLAKDGGFILMPIDSQSNRPTDHTFQAPLD